MATARKLPSGSWRVRVFSHTDADGKKHYESFTAPTKAKAESLASKWSEYKNRRPEDIVVREAVSRYIDTKRNVLSPKTVRTYVGILRTSFDGIGNVKLKELRSASVQMWISDLSKDLAPKTVKNTYGLFTAAVSMFAPDLSLKVTLPVNKKATYYIPPDKDVKKLLTYCEGKELWIAIMLARYYSLRRGEITALTSDDLLDNMLWITKDEVMDENGKWIIKDTPKTSDSYRRVKLSDPLLSVLQAKEGRFITCNPDALLNRFRRALTACDIKSFNFHALRHSFASNAALAGIPDIYTARIGGWAPGSPILKTVYQNTIDSELDRQMDKLNKSMTRNMSRK